LAPPVYHNPHGRNVEDRRNHAALQGGPNPPKNCVITPMFDHSITHGVIGIIKCPFYVQENISLAGEVPSQHVPRADEGPFPPISQPGKHVDWDAMAVVPSFHRCLSTSLSMVLRRNNVRLIGLKSSGPLWEFPLGLRINTTLTCRHMAGT